MTAATTTEIFLIAMGIIFTVPYLIWRFLRTDYYAPLVVVQILAGMLLGPGILGKFFPAYYAYVFRPAVIAPLNGIAWWAVMLFVCIAGIELDLKKVWRHRSESVTAAALALGMPLLFGSLAALGLLRYAGDRRTRLALAVRARGRHGVRGHGPPGPGSAHGKTRDSSPAAGAATAPLRKPR